MTEAERAEQRLIEANGIHPYPWKVQGVEDGLRIVDANEVTVIDGFDKRSVAKAIVESYNRHPIVILEDDVVY